MKKLFVFTLFLLIVFIPFLSYSQDSTAVTPTPQSGITLTAIVITLLAVLEAIVRAIPSVTNYSPVHFVLELLTWLSGKLNVQKKP